MGFEEGAKDTETMVWSWWFGVWGLVFGLGWVVCLSKTGVLIKKTQRCFYRPSIDSTLKLEWGASFQ